MKPKRIAPNKYRIRIELGVDENGNRRRKYFTLSNVNKEQAEIEQAKLMKKYYHKYKKLNSTDFTFKEYSEYFLMNYCEKNVSKITTNNYKYMLVDINNLIGNYKIKDIDTDMLDRMYKKLRIGRTGKELSPKTMSHYYNLINIMFKQAKRWKRIDENPNEDCIKPKLPKSKRRFYELPQIIELFNCLSNESIKYKTIISLGLICGIRRGELCALKWNDIDFNNNSVCIDNSLKEFNGIIDEEKAKTEYSVRTIYFGEIIKNYLQEYKKWQNDYISKMGDKWKEQNRIFTKKDGDNIHPDTINKILQKVLKKYNLPKISYHELRHTFATTLNGNNVDPKTISALMGHADTSITMNLYTHTLENNKKAVANVFDDLLKPYI